MDLEKEYSPSQCSHRALKRNPDELIDSFVKIHIEETARVKKVYKSRLDVRYGNSQRQSMDIYFKEKESDTPIFVYIHGGYWIDLSKAESGICVAPLVERGYRVVVMDYDLCPSVTLEEIVTQTKKFIQFLLQYATETNAETISFCGHSAGAHLIANLLQKDCLNLPNANLIKNLFLISGIYDLRDLRKTQAVNPNNILSLDEKSAEKLSPILFEFCGVAAEIQICIISGEHDSGAFRQQSRNFFDKLKSNDFRVKFEMLTGYDHFTIIEELRNDESLVMGLILKELGLK